jgi:capsule polysaccharide export protein KpsE/RkpR
MLRADRNKKVYNQTMEMQQMMERLLAKMGANQAKMDATIKEIRASQQHLEEEMLDKMEAKIGANQEKMDAWIAEMRTWQIETTACQEAMEACLESKEPTSLAVGSMVLHGEVPEEEATVKTVAALKKRHRTGI